LDIPRLKSWTRCLLLAAVSIAVVGARPSAESVLDREPGALLDKLVEEKLAVVQGGGGDGPESFVVAYVLFDKSHSEVLGLLKQAARQTEYRPELKSVKTVETFPDGRLDEQVLKIMFRKLKYRLRYNEDPTTGRLEWKLDPTFDNSLKRMEGFWELYAFADTPNRTLGRFGSSVDVGQGVPKFIQREMGRKTVLRYVRNCRQWIDSNGEWRP
jgi:hypothetical protein